MSAQPRCRLASCYRHFIMLGDNISFCIRTWGQSGKQARPQTKQKRTQKNSITERCINQFCVKQQAHYVTAYCAVAICAEMDSDCHKQKPPEETWHPSQPGYTVWDAKLLTSPHSRCRKRQKGKKRFPKEELVKNAASAVARRENRGPIRRVGKENHVCFWRGTGLPGTVTQTLFAKSVSQRGLAHTAWEKTVVTGGRLLNENTTANTEPVNIPDNRGLNEERCTRFEQIRWQAAEWRLLSLRCDVFQIQFDVSP